MPKPPRYNSLEDFLVTNPLSVDATVNHGVSVFPVKGTEIDATILFADISGFSERTLHMSSTETLAFVNYFFCVVTNGALQGRGALVDKYIGDEIMVVFSNDFGASDPFREAVEAARCMAESDVLNFAPHIGIASGRVTVGYVGTTTKYNCSAFGAPVALAARCAGVKIEPPLEHATSCIITFPAVESSGHDMDLAFSSDPQARQSWRVLSARDVPLKNLPVTKVQQIVTTGIYLSRPSPEDRAREILEKVRRAGRYWPRNDGSGRRAT